MPDASGSSWRGVFLGTLVGIVLSPLSLALNYYTNRAFTSPKLRVEYITPIVEIAPLAVDKNLFPVWQQFQLGAPLPTDFSLSQCNSEFQSGSLSLNCARHLQSAIAGDLSFNQQMQKAFADDEAIIKAWNGNPKSVPNLLPISMPSFDLETAIREAPKNDVIAILQDYAAAGEKAMAQMAALVAQLDKFISSAVKPRSGNITFKVGVLNAGDSDALIFPDATLAFQESRLALVASPVYPIGPDVTPARTPQYSVVKGHAFAEITFTVDDAASEPKAIYAWKDLVIHAAQQDYLISLASSSKGTITGNGRLPPGGKE